MNELDFAIGQLTAEVKNLSKELADLSLEVANTKNKLEDINLWRSKVFGVSLGASFVGSAVVQLLVILWPR